MGATKRVAELLVLQMAQKSQTRFLAVRFGNVLGSNGRQVVPHFLTQIEQGGPVTVTHPDMQRYFMLIPEAVQLVLHAAALGQQGAVYVLEMGKQIRVLDMACNLIRLAGLTPEKDIPIVFVGLRPGEKLSQELVGVDETVLPSGVEGIVCVQPRVLPEAAWLTQQVAALEWAALQGDVAATLRDAAHRGADVPFQLYVSWKSSNGISARRGGEGSDLLSAMMRMQGGETPTRKSGSVGVDHLSGGV